MSIMKSHFFAAAVIISTAITAFSAPPETALLSRWKFDEGYGTGTSDSSPVRNHQAKIINGQWIDGISGKAVEFDGSGYAETPLPGSIVPLNGFTIDFYFRPGNTRNYQYVFGAKCNPSPGVPGFGIFIRLAQGTFLECGISTSRGWQEVKYFGTMEKGKWYRFTMIVEKGRYRVFLDGKQYGERVIPEVKYNNALLFYAGRNPWTEKDKFIGAIDELNYYNRAIDPEELFADDPLAGEKNAAVKEYEAAAKYFYLCKLVRQKALPVELDEVKKLFTDYAANRAEIRKKLDILGKKSAQPDFEYTACGKVYTVSPTSPSAILPDDDPAAKGALAAKELMTVAAQGEYEAASFIFRAAKNLKNVSVKVELPGFPQKNIDIKYLICWLRDGGAWSKHLNSTRSLPSPVPELLVNDPEFINRRFDLQPPLITGNGSKVIPVKDADKLLPCNIGAGKNQQYIITFNTGKDVKSGIYRGKVILSSGSEKIAEIPLTLRVLPVKLPAAMTRYDLDSPIEYSVYYWGHPTFDKVVPLGGVMRSMERFEAEMKNLAAHGITSPAFTLRGAKYQYERPAENRHAIRLAVKNGLCRNGIYFGGSIDARARSKAQLEEVYNRVNKLIRMIRAAGVKSPVYIYGQDEQTTKLEHEVQFPAKHAIHRAGALNWVSTFPDAFDYVKESKTLDLANAYGVPSREEAAKWHSIGSKVWNYGAPQAGEWDPSVYRRNAGMVLWSNNYDGFCDYCYCDPFVIDSKRQFNPYFLGYGFVVPTINGVINTLAWEGFREASDDVRFITALRLLARNKGIDELKKADAFLDSFKPVEDDVELIRYMIIDEIIKLKEVK